MIECVGPPGPGKTKTTLPLILWTYCVLNYISISAMTLERLRRWWPEYKTPRNKAVVFRVLVGLKLLCMTILLLFAPTIIYVFEKQKRFGWSSYLSTFCWEVNNIHLTMRACLIFMIICYPPHCVLRLRVHYCSGHFALVNVSHHAKTPDELL